MVCMVAYNWAVDKTKSKGNTLEGLHIIRHILELTDSLVFKHL